MQPVPLPRPDDRDRQVATVKLTEIVSTRYPSLERYDPSRLDRMTLALVIVGIVVAVAVILSFFMVRR